MCRAATLFVAALVSGCAPASPTVHWTCDFDASESRPLSDPAADAGPDGDLPASVCQNTCGPPATRCTITLLEGGLRGAICPVCTF